MEKKNRSMVLALDVFTIEMQEIQSDIHEF